jgi:hypothetical protein
MEESWRWFAVFGEPRQTVNADLVARLLGRHAELLVERLAGEFYADLPTIVSAIQTQGCFNLIHPTGIIWSIGRANWE